MNEKWRAFGGTLKTGLYKTNGVFKKVRSNRIFTYCVPILALVVVVLLFGALTGGRFLRVANLNLILNQSLAIAIVATGGVLIYSSGNMNIALGGSTAIACIIGAKVYLAVGSIPLMLLACVVGGLVIMGLCLILNQIFRIGIIVITIVMMTMLMSLQEWLVGGTPISIPYADMSPLQSMQLPLIIGVIFFVICIWLFDFTKTGRELKFIGENENCARQTGLGIKKMLVLAFLISGVAVGLGAFATLVRVPTISKESCSSMNMDIILAIVLAGTPMNGGTKSKIFSGVVGALLVTALGNGLLMIGVSAIWIQGIRGILFLIILVLSVKRPDVLPVKDMY